MDVGGDEEHRDEEADDGDDDDEDDDAVIDCRVVPFDAAAIGVAAAVTESE